MNRFLTICKINLIVFLFSTLVFGKSVKIFGKKYDIDKTEYLDISFNELNKEKDSSVVGDILSKIKVGSKKKKIKKDKDQLTEIPEEVFSLTHLKYLYLSGHLLKKLPSKIGLLVNLEHLDISHNEIKKIPESISNLVNLQHIDFSHNCMKEFPIVLSRLPQIKNIDCHDNPFTYFLAKSKINRNNSNDIGDKNNEFVVGRYFYSSIIIKTPGKTIEKWKEDFVSMVLKGGWFSPAEHWMEGGLKMHARPSSKAPAKKRNLIGTVLNVAKNRYDLGPLVILNNDADAPPINMIIRLDTTKNASLLGLVFKKGDFRFTPPEISRVYRTNNNNWDVLH